MTIPLPPLPEPKGNEELSAWPVLGKRDYTVTQLRAIQREAMRVALEAAAFHLRGADRHLTDLQISDQIRALEIGT